MNHRDAELTDVLVVLVDEPGMTPQDAAKMLADKGLSVSDVNETEGIIEGTIKTASVGSLKELHFVKYVRGVFSYTADYPPDDPRNQDTDDDDLPAEADDAGI